jgi:hypothetical protein
MASRRVGYVPLNEQVELLRKENNTLKRENEVLARTHEANIELQQQVDTLKRENEVLARTHEANIELQQQVDTLKHEFNNFRTISTYYNLSSLQVPHGVWVFAPDVLHALNRAHSNFQGVFFDDFRALLGENDDAVYVRRMGNYIRLMQSMYMFVRVERPIGSLRFVLAYVKCDLVFSFALRFEQMRLRLNCIPPVVLTNVEVEENKALRLACVGETDYERALARYRNENGKPPLNAALEAKDEESAMVLLDGGDDPNEVDGNGQNALHTAAREGCRPPLFQRVVARIHDVNTVKNGRWTALMYAARNNQLDVVISLMNHPRIDLNVQDRWNNSTALHCAVHNNHHAIVSQLLSDDKIDASLKDNRNYTALKDAIVLGRAECVTILRQHGAPE